MQESDDEYDDGANGTPKAPRLSIEGRTERTCPGAPSKGRAPHRFLNLSADAPVRRLNFFDCGSPVSSDDCNMLTDMADAAVSPVRHAPQQNGLQHPQSPQQQHVQSYAQQQLVGQDQQQWFQGQQPQQQQLHQQQLQQQYPSLHQPYHHQPQQQQSFQQQQPRTQQARSRQLFAVQDSPSDSQLQQRQQLPPHQHQQQLWSPLSPAPGSARQQLAGDPPNTTPARLFR